MAMAVSGGTGWAPVPLLLRVHLFKPGYHLAMAGFGHDLDKTELLSYMH